MLVGGRVGRPQQFAVQVDTYLPYLGSQYAWKQLGVPGLLQTLISVWRSGYTWTCLKTSISGRSRPGITKFTNHHGDRICHLAIPGSIEPTECPQWGLGPQTIMLPYQHGFGDRKQGFWDRKNHPATMPATAFRSFNHHNYNGFLCLLSALAITSPLVPGEKSQIQARIGEFLQLVASNAATHRSTSQAWCLHKVSKGRLGREGLLFSANEAEARDGLPRMWQARGQ